MMSMTKTYKVVFVGVHEGSIVSARHPKEPETVFQHADYDKVEHWVFHQEMVGHPRSDYQILAVVETQVATPPIREA